tara:strand:- start:2983 stop:3171 length:189 start_codon:yes stop_codon:yes gene_type:complete
MEKIKNKYTGTNKHTNFFDQIEKHEEELSTSMCVLLSIFGIFFTIVAGAAIVDVIAFFYNLL